MAGDNKVQIVISARDDASGTIRTIQGTFNSMVTNVTAATFAFNNIKAATDTAIAAIRSILDPSLKFDALGDRLDAITGSATLATEEMKFVTTEAKRLGLELASSVDSYSSFIASTKNSGMEGEKARKIWVGMAEAIAAQKLPAETSSRVMWQLTQMVSKGKVTMEDLNIVAEALPGTLQAVADSMGITKERVFELSQRSELLANDVLPKLGEHFHNAFGKKAEEAAKKGQGAINNFNTEVLLAKKNLGDLILPSVTQGLNVISSNFNTLTAAAEILAGAGMAVVIGRIGNATVTAAVQQAQFVKAVVSGNAVMLDSLSVGKAKAQTELLAARSVEAHTIALVEKARAEVIAANATRDAFAATILKGQADQGLAVAEAELAIATNATSAAQARYAEATAAATITSRAAAGAASLMTGAMAMVGGPIGLAVVALGAMVWSLKSVDKEVEEQARKRKEEQTKAEADARQAVADTKDREDRIVGIMGSSTDKQIQDLRRRTEEKVAQLDKDREAEDKAANYNYEATQKSAAKYSAAKEKLLRDSAASERKIRNDSVKEEVDDKKEQLKAAEDYYAAIGDMRGKEKAALDSDYQDKLKALHTYYNAEMARANETGADVSGLEEKKQKAIFQLQLMHSVKRGLLGEADKKRALDIATSEGNERIALIRKQIADRVRTETDGEKEIAAIQADLAQKEYDSTVRIFEQISAVYGNDSKEYIEAQRNKEAAFQKLTTAQITQTQKAEEEQRQAIEKSTVDYKLELDKRMDWLADSERDGLITHQQAARDRLEAEVNYARQIAGLRARELASTTPDTVEYKQALAEKYAADREYYEKKKALDDGINAEILGRYQAEAAAADESAKKEQASFRSFADWFYAQWDAITQRVTSLGPKMAAAFGNPLKASEDTIEGLRLKMEEVAEATRKAAEMSRDYFQFSRLLGEHATKAEKLRYEYYSQKLTLAELTEQLKKMTYATEDQIRRSTGLVDSMNLIDESDLSNVRSEIDRLTDAMKEAEEQARDTVDSLRDELDQMLGNKEAVENRDYEAKRKELEAKMKEADAAGNTEIFSEYRTALDLLEEIHERKLATIREEAVAAAKAAEEAHTAELQRIEEEKKAREEALKSGTATNPSTALGFATDGRLPGPDSRYDNIWVKARTGEWFIRNEAARFWGDSFMAGVNDPMSDIGRRIQDHMAGIIHTVTAPVFAPKVTFTTGGPVLSDDRPQKSGHTFVINTTEPVDERFVRRHIIPVLERYERRKR